MKFSKVRITDNRPPGAGGNSPLERRGATRGGSVSGLDALTMVQKKEAAEHDRAVANFEAETLIEIAADLGRRSAWNRKDPEQRWVMARRAAVLRKLSREGAL